MAGTPVQVLRAEVTLNPAADSDQRIMNVWHFATVGAGTPAATATNVYTGLNAFYQAIDAQLSTELSTLVPQVRWFNYIEPKPRQPFQEDFLTALVTGTTRAQRELAVCLSYKAQYVSGVTPKRRRGRIYLGPFSGGVVDSATGKLAAASKTVIVNAGQVFLDLHQAATTWSWVVYSPTTDTAGTGEAGAYEVLSAWVDDELDTQRRRGMPQPGAKTIMT